MKDYQQFIEGIDYDCVDKPERVARALAEFSSPIQWPENHLFRSTIEKYMNSMRGLADRMFTLFEQVLGGTVFLTNEENKLRNAFSNPNIYTKYCHFDVFLMLFWSFLRHSRTPSSFPPLPSLFRAPLS